MNGENVTKSKRGGKRAGAGRKRKSGFDTVVVRVPAGMKNYILPIVEIYTDWMKKDGMEVTERTTVKERMQAVGLMEGLVQHERTRQARTVRQCDDKRQMNLFGNDNRT